MSRAYPTKNEARAYGDGYAQGEEDSRLLAQHEARVVAFGAIRRAIKAARWCDREAAFWSVLNSDYSDEYTWCAFVIRRAIRAAIGSEKT